MRASTPPVEPAGVVRGADAPELSLGSLGVRLLVTGEQTGGAYAIVEHPLAPRGLGAETHTHANEDEVSYVVEGQVGVLVGDREEVAGPGDVIVKPRGIRHAFWNAGDAPARVLELIAPAGFERFFAEIAPLAERGWDDPEVLEELGRVADRYGLTFEEGALESIVERHGLRLDAA